MANITIMEIPSLQDIKQLNRLNRKDLRLNSLDKKDKYNWFRNFLDKVRYKRLSKKNKNYIIDFLCNITKDSQSNIYHLIGKYWKGRLYAKDYVRKNPHKRYTAHDLQLLSQTDIYHKRLSAQATKKLLIRAFKKYGQAEFENISQISIPHINNLRKRRAYSCHYLNGTKATQVQIGERIKPIPDGKPGYIRVDTVHQRDVYYINSIDEVTQWELVFCVKAYSDFFLEPILQLMLETFPFKIINFHSDNGSEFINKTVAKILNRLLIRQTKSRSRKCNDNALIECKNGCIIRKHMGYGYIAEELAPRINQYCVDYFNVYLNFHRPCAFQKEKLVSAKSKRTVYFYEEYATPYEKLKSLNNVNAYLKNGITLKELDKIENAFPDLVFAMRMEKERCKVFDSFKPHNYDDLIPPNSLL